MQYLIGIGVIGMLLLYCVIVVRCTHAPEW